MPKNKGKIGYYQKIEQHGCCGCTLRSFIILILLLFTPFFAFASELDKSAAAIKEYAPNSLLLGNASAMDDDYREFLGGM